ncbi:MAG: hypothetical protein A2252_11885 [Elusimicrobia bacterium RIFOXYA2_FULL_39_19]|nr:MAG: hypothetical protein A2252_11885 [Elusimicrobia bacterium RIFOXYA2_FULL_39_19]
MHQFLENTFNTRKQSTKHLRFTQLKAFFNFCINILNINIQNPCCTLLLNKTYRINRPVYRTIVSKELIDEIIYKTTKTRDRLLLEIQARSGLRIGEALNLCPKHIKDRRIKIESPKSRKDFEFAYLPSNIADKLKQYITQNQISTDQKIFNLSYAGARNIIRKAGQQLGVALKPHDLRRYSASFASRNGVPLEVVSKVILRHQNLVTTQVYLGKISEEEALRWVDSLHNR